MTRNEVITICIYIHQDDSLKVHLTRGTRRHRSEPSIKTLTEHSEQLLQCGGKFHILLKCNLYKAH